VPTWSAGAARRCGRWLSPGAAGETQQVGDALRRTNLPLQLTAGRPALAARRFPDAVKAFEAAL
jgi:hypothetical protein